jgi:opacity protein-like surface antigen
MRTLTLIAAFCLLLLGTTAHAQESFFTARYQVGVPLGDLNDYIDKSSWRGVGLGYRWVPDGDVTIGFDLAWQGFDKRNTYDTYTRGTASISGIQYRYQNCFQLSAQTEYVFNEGGDFRPYVGIGVGAMHVRRLTSFGLYEISQDPWQFMLKPGLGFSYYLKNGTALQVGADYVVGFQNKELTGQSYMALNLGLIFSTN